MSNQLAQSNSLADLAARIQTQHQAVEAALKDSVQHAIAAGELLIEAKSQLKHGQWLPWLRDHRALSERSAQRYIRLARNKAVIEAKYDTMSDLTLNGALALLTVPRETIDDSLLESFVDHLDEGEVLTNALRSQAEIARRRVLLDQAKRNDEACKKIAERLGIDLSDRTKPISDELLSDFPDVGAAYEAAVMADDYDAAFALAEWLHEFTAEVLAIAEKAEAEAA